MAKWADDTFGGTADLSALLAANTQHRRRDEHLSAQLHGDEATLADVLLDLAERQCTVRVSLANSAATVGIVSGVGADVVALRSTAGRLHLLRIGCVETIAADAPASQYHGARRRHAMTTFDASVREAAADRLNLLAWGGDALPVSGQIVNAAADHLVLVDDQRRQKWLALNAIQMVVLS